MHISIRIQCEEAKLCHHIPCCEGEVLGNAQLGEQRHMTKKTIDIVYSVCVPSVAMGKYFHLIVDIVIGLV